jgi:hypothetical protein
LQGAQGQIFTFLPTNLAALSCLENSPDQSMLYHHLWSYLMNAAQFLLTISMIVAAQTPMRQLHAETTASRDVQLPPTSAPCKSQTR